MRWSSGALLGALVLAAMPSCIGTKPARVPIAVSLPHRSVRLPNGLTVVTHVDESSPVAAVALAVATGAGDDPPGREGLAHAVEHLAFRSEHSGPSVRLRFDRMGAAFNGWTSTEATVYIAAAPKSELASLVRAFADIAKNPVEGVTAETLDTERGVLDNERRLRDENGSPGEVVDRLRALVYGQRPLGKSIGGTAQSLRAMGIDDARAFARAHYRPSSMTVTISGPLGDTRALLEPFAAIPAVSTPEPPPPSGAPKPPVLDDAGIEHVPSSVSTPELWLGWALPSAYGKDAAAAEIVANMASGALATGAWDRHADVTSGFCFIDRGKQASMLACRAHLSSTEHLGAVKRSILDVIRRGIAARATERDRRYVYTRFMATEELLDHERLVFRAQELLLGAHFARDPGFSLKRIQALESAESDAIMTLYDRALTAETTRAVLAEPASTATVGAVPLVAHRLESAGAELPPIERVLAAIEPFAVSERKLENGLRVLAVQRAGASFQTALLGFFDGEARVPPAVADAARWSYRSYLVEPPRGVLQSFAWDADATRRIVRSGAGDMAVLLKRLDDGLENFDFDWKSEAYLDFTKGAKARENDARERTPREFRQALFGGHPYGSPVVSADVDAVTVRQIRDWYDAVHRPENALLVLVGGQRPEALLAAASEKLGGWQRQAKREPTVLGRAPLAPSERVGQRLLVGHRPTESQVAIGIGCVLPPTSAASAATEDVLASLLDEALDEELRQRTGATYGVFVALERLRGGTNVLHVTSSVANEQIAPSLDVLYAWFAADGELVTESAVALARFDAIQSTLLGTETSLDLANELFEYARRGLSAVDLNEYPGRVAAVEPDAVRRLLAECRRTSLFSAVGDERIIRSAWPGYRNARTGP